MRHSIVAEGCDLDDPAIDHSIVGIRTSVRAGARVTRSVLLGADYYEGQRPRPDGAPPLGIGEGTVLDRVIVDKNARIGRGVRLVNERARDEADGDGYVIRNGIVIVPKGASVPDGTTT